MPKNLKPQEKSLYPTNSILDTYPNIAVTHSNTVLAVIKLEHLSTSTRVFQGPKKMQENEAECIHSWGKVHLYHFIVNAYVFQGINDYRTVK